MVISKYSEFNESKLGRYFKRQPYIVDHDNRKVHRMSKITDMCNISNDTEFATELQVRNYKIYDYYISCPYCIKKT